MQNSRVTDRIGKLLEKEVKTVFKPTKKNPAESWLYQGQERSASHSRGIQDSVHMWPVPTRIGEHKRHCRLGHTEKSAVAEHAFKEGNHRILFEETEVLDNTLRSYFPRLIREAIEIHKHQ
ncbi:hypothetical protein NQ315_016481 [Exocentrus adspersus]|uniref:Uncharacterized protein n=1 Tax=Exocentrus adspersus TaxID=1586481 RepID=A0AAV8VYJ2_9CUCU|nr:hypothetical protein NQ315_016481 [Exocentrus adspersus]